MRVLRLADLPSGGVYLKIPHHADPSKNEAWLEKTRLEMIDTPIQFRREILMEDVGPGAIFTSFESKFRNPEGEPMAPQIVRVKDVGAVAMIGKNVCDPFAVPSEWQAFSGHDFGPRNTAAVFAAQDPQTGNIYIYAAYHQNAEPAHHAKNFLKLARRKSPPRAWGGSNTEDGWRADYAAVGYPIDEPPYSGSGSVMLRIERAHSLMMRGKIIIFSNLTNLISDIEAYSWEVDPQGVPLEGKIANQNAWHRIDALCYLLLALYEGIGDPLPPPLRRVESSHAPINPFLADIEERERAMRVAYGRGRR